MLIIVLKYKIIRYYFASLASNTSMREVYPLDPKDLLIQLLILAKVMKLEDQCLNMEGVYEEL